MREDKFFKIGMAMAEVLSGKKQAISDLKLLLEENPEMIDQVKYVAHSIQEIENKQEN
ncbi:hypothetical protein ACNSOL_10940 [Aliarcobacter lanthieri]|uniref:hypothetical protein n=1 Tax=Aliarcobacter lanthieri TaxID=1355374 RepID=UPI003AAD9247